MRLVYVDESGAPNLRSPDPNYPLFVMAGCVFDAEESCQGLAQATCTLKIGHFHTDAIILHESEIRKQLGPFYFQGDTSRRLAFVDELSNLVNLHVPQVIAAAILPSIIEIDAEARAVESLWATLQEYPHSPTRWIFERRGKKEDEHVRQTLLRLNGEAASVEFVPKLRGLPGLEMADMVARPIGLSVLRPTQTNRALDCIRQRLRLEIIDK